MLNVAATQLKIVGSYKNCRGAKLGAEAEPYNVSSEGRESRQEGAIRFQSQAYISNKEQIYIIYPDLQP